MSWDNLTGALGGIALFLLAMLMMTEGLKAFAGAGLRRLLERWTSTPLRGVWTGALVAGVVQSSSAVIVATIGLVNAGALTLRQALGVVFGTNVGTTMTGWLVSIVGLGFRIESFALPILAVGVTLRLTAPGKRYQGLGQALAGFGLFFLGLAALKAAFADLAGAYGAGLAGGVGQGWPAYLGAGFLATLLTQSSSAAIAIILTAAASGVVGLEAAAAAVIGANLGTTSTAVLAVLKATPSARRLAAGHVLFNLVTAAVALALLPVLVWVVGRLADGLVAGPGRASELALFHTVFNLLGVALMLPLTGRLAAGLERRFRGPEEDLSRPRHLDATLSSTPVLAVGALRQELARLCRLVSGLAHASLRGADEPVPLLEQRAEAVRALGAAIAHYVGTVRTESMIREVGDDLAQALRVARYLDEAARLAPRVRGLRTESGARMADETDAQVAAVLTAAERCIALAGGAGPDPGAEGAATGGDAERAAALDRFEAAYRQAKSALLAGAVHRRLPVPAAEARLDSLSALRRLVGQLVKADRLLLGAGRAADIEADPDGA